MKMEKYDILDDRDYIYYYKKGTTILHRLDGPAVEWSSGHKEWWIDGQRHRIDGPVLEQESGDKFWFINDLLHRLDGPAVINDYGYEAWYINGKRHRLDGPVLHSWGSKQWWIDGIRLSPEKEAIMNAWYENGRI